MKLRKRLAKEYVVVIRAGSRLRIDENERLEVHTDIDGHKCVLTFRSRYFDEGYESQVPRDLWIDARGSHKSLNAAVTAFTDAASFFTTVISFCMNGFAGECTFHLAFDNSARKRKRDFFEQLIADERGLPPLTRKVHPEYVVQFIDALSISEHGERLKRAINQYVLALERWTKGKEILATAHLFMGMEALVAVVRKIELSNAGLSTSQELADLLGVELKNLDPTIRRNYLFQKDEECHRDAKNASDGIEHGYLSYAEIRPLAERARDKTARYLREAIINLINLSEEIKSGLLSPPYSNPIGTESYIRYLRAALISKSLSLAPAGQEYPSVDWMFKVSGFHLTSDGKLDLSISQSLTPRLADGVTFSPKSVELYGPEGIISESAGHKEVVEPRLVPASQIPDKHFKETIRLLKRIRDKISEFGEGDSQKSNFVNAELLRLISRCRSRYASILLLIEMKFGDEALDAYKSLIQDASKLIYISTEMEEKDALIAGFLHQSVDVSKGLILDFKDLGFEADAERAIEEMETVQAQLEQQVEWSIKENSHNLINLLETRPAFISKEAYWVYLLARPTSAGYSLPYPSRKRKVGDDREYFEALTHDFDFLKMVGIHSAELILQSTQAAGDILGWPGISALDEDLAVLREHSDRGTSSG